MLQSYEKEQKVLTQEVADSRQTLEEAKQKTTDLRLLLRTLREMTEINELTLTLVNSLIERIEVHNNDKSSGHCYVKVDIYFTAVGMIDIPTEQEILAMMGEIRKNYYLLQNLFTQNKNSDWCFSNQSFYNVI